MAVGEGSLAAGDGGRGGPVAAREEGKGWERGGEEGAEEEEGGALVKEMRGRGRPAQCFRRCPGPKRFPFFFERETDGVAELALWFH